MPDVPSNAPTDAYADVVVVGAGQAGLAVAAHLARSGFTAARPADPADAPRPGGARSSCSTPRPGPAARGGSAGPA